MKNIKFLAFSFAALTLLTGCGEKEENNEEVKEEKNGVVSCTLSDEESGLEMDQEIDIEHKDNKIKVITLTFDFKATDKEIKDSWEEFVTILDATYPEQDKDGLKIETSSNSKNYIYTIVIEIDLENATEEVLEELGFENISGNEDVRELKQKLKTEGYTCE